MKKIYYIDLSKFTMLDGPPEYEEAFSKAILDSLTEKEKEEAMSSKYDYLDD